MTKQPYIIIPLINNKIFIYITFPKLLQKINLKYKISHLTYKTITIYFRIKFIKTFNLKYI